MNTSPLHVQDDPSDADFDVGTDTTAAAPAQPVEPAPAPLAAIEPVPVPAPEKGRGLIARAFGAFTARLGNEPEAQIVTDDAAPEATDVVTIRRLPPIDFAGAIKSAPRYPDLARGVGEMRRVLKRRAQLAPSLIEERVAELKVRARKPDVDTAALADEIVGFRERAKVEDGLLADRQRDIFLREVVPPLIDVLGAAVTEVRDRHAKASEVEATLRREFGIRERVADRYEAVLQNLEAERVRLADPYTFSMSGVLGHGNEGCYSLMHQLVPEETEAS
jgi:hypothetical protein